MSIHSRESLHEIFKVLNEFKNNTLTGVLHCFSGSLEEANQAIKLNFKIGIGGTITYKNSLQSKFLHKIDLKHIVVETDSPWLPPSPHRGKRNESSYTRIIAEKLAEIYQIPVEEVAEITTKSALEIYKIE